jgi:hypothetical protein
LFWFFGEYRDLRRRNRRFVLPTKWSCWPLKVWLKSWLFTALGQVSILFFFKSSAHLDKIKFGVHTKIACLYPFMNVLDGSWRTATYFWTSGTDIATEGIWVWESTGVNLYPGYANWGTSEPDTLDGEDCILIHSTVGWQDYGCGSVQDGVCEAR